MRQFILLALLMVQYVGAEELPYSPPYQRTCTIPTGVNDACKAALQADCYEILSCLGNKECIANRHRTDISSCEEEAPRITFAKPNLDHQTKEPSPPTTTPAASNRNQQSTPDAIETINSPATTESPDPQPCMTALSNARRACDTNQASSFNNQVSGGSQGLTGAAVATTGTQNVNNIIVNCSNSQQLCASACSQAQMPDVQNECQRLESNLKSLAHSADTSFDNASNELTYFSSSSPYLLDQKQKANASINGEPTSTQEIRAEENYKNANQNLKPSQLDLSTAESPSALSENSPTSTNFNDAGNLPSSTESQENYALETSLGIPKPYAPGIASALINGSSQNSNNAAVATTGSTKAIQAQKQTADQTPSTGESGYIPPTYSAIGTNAGNGFNSYSKIGDTTGKLKNGFSIFANWRSSIRELYEDFMRGPTSGKSRSPASDRGRLGIDTQLSMEPLPEVPHGRLPEIAFGATILSLSVIGLWRLKTLLALKGALKAAQLAEQAQRRLSQRRSSDIADRRIQSSLFREGEVERRKSSEADRRTQQRSERRLAS